jgi:hypothetical protein
MFTRIGHGGRRGHPQPKLITVCEIPADQVLSMTGALKIMPGRRSDSSGGGWPRRHCDHRAGIPLMTAVAEHV